MKIMKNVLACLLAVALLGTCIVCSAAESEVTTVSVDSIYLSTSSSKGTKALTLVETGKTLAVKKTNRYYFVYRLSDEQLAKLGEAQSVTFDVKFAKDFGADYNVALISQDKEKIIFSLADAWGVSGAVVTNKIND